VRQISVYHSNSTLFLTEFRTNHVVLHRFEFAHEFCTDVHDGLIEHLGIDDVEGIIEFFDNIRISSPSA